MYDDPSRWSLAFQSYVQLTMMQLHTKKCSRPIKMMERSIYSGRHCFIENLYRYEQRYTVQKCSYVQNIKS